MSDRFLLAVAATVGVPVLVLGYISLVEGALARLAPNSATRVRPWLWLGPAIVLLAVFLVYPALNTIVISFFNANSTHFVGLQNYHFIFSDGTMRAALRNNALWLVLFTLMTVGLGLIIAILVDRVPYEAVAKSIVFLPMAISFVAAGVIWKFMYDYRPPGAPQTGTVNAALLALIPGFTPRAWLITSPLNNIALIVAAVWIWTGFASVILSASLKGIPAETLDAARVDGAGEWQMFWRITLPLLWPTVLVVSTVMIVTALKAFDIVYVMTGGNYGTDVIANRMYKEMFNVRNFGRASGLAVILLIAIIPVMAFNLRRFSAQGEGR